MNSQLDLLGEEGGGNWLHIPATVAGEVEHREIRPYVLLALKELSGEGEERIRNITNADRFACVRAVVRHLVRLRSARSGNIYNLDTVRTFVEGLRFTPECAAELTTLLCTEELYAGLPATRCSGQRLVSVHCRLDISLCQVNLAANPAADADARRAVLHRDAFVVLTLQLRSGESRVCRMTVPQYHELRFHIATLLKNMIVLERRRAVRRD